MHLPILVPPDELSLAEPALPLNSTQRWEHAIVEHDSVGDCIKILYASGSECHGEDVSHEALLAVIAGLGAKGWEMVAATDAFSPCERRVRSYAFKRLHD